MNSGNSIAVPNIIYILSACCFEALPERRSTRSAPHQTTRHIVTVPGSPHYALLPGYSSTGLEKID
jgi:hypothetical protein